MRGYFGLGIEGDSKAMNVGSPFRSANAFGASFVFTLGATYARHEGAKSDTSDTPGRVPFYGFPDTGALILPEGCVLVGVELAPDAVELPTFHHPHQAACVLGPERGGLSPETIERCGFVVRIPTAFSLNVGIAGAIVIYDRLISLGHFQRRPIGPGAPSDPVPQHVFGDPKRRRKMEKFRATPPEGDITTAK